VEQIMTRAPFTVGPKTPLIDAVSKMIAKRINCLPVIDEHGAVCGIVTSTDLLKSYQKVLELLQKPAAES
jgi:CBS domain-containing protein